MHRGVLAVVAAALASALSASAAEIKSTTREPGAVISDQLTTEQVNALAEMVRLHGYKCDSISGARRWLTSYGFTLHCNSFRYEYEIRDKGGHWTVTVE